MIIIPAIDLKDGQCVRLFKGEFASAHKVADSAIDTARSFSHCGAQLIHMVDLDGALVGADKNRAVVREVIERINVPVELGGGIRSMQDVEAALTLGISRVIIGSAAVETPSLVREAVSQCGSRIAVGIDAMNGHVKTHGWTVDSGLDFIEFAKRVEDFGVKTIIFTDIDSDGMLAGPA
ncbi:MAG: HisA/HisF-related TIM barrel protein, partial [Clostridia bacterium]